MGISLSFNLRTVLAVSKPRRLSFPTRNLKQFCTPSPFPNGSSQSYSTVLLWPFLNCWKKIDLLRSGILLISHISSISFSDLVNNICTLHTNACEKFVFKILENPSHPRLDDLYKCWCDLRVRAFPYPTVQNRSLPKPDRVLVNKHLVMAELRAHLIWLTLHHCYIFLYC